jgi:TolB-like protein
MAGLEGRQLDRYRIVERLGGGGSAEVYRARDQQRNCLVMIEVLGAADAEGGDVLRHDSEAREAAALDHPNILAIDAQGVHEGRPFIVTEPFEGRSVREAIDSRKLTNRDVVEYVSQIATGLAAAHDRGVVHGGVRPSRLLVRSDGVAMVMGFGLHRLEVQDPGEPAANSGGAPEKPVRWATGYLSPEQISGQGADPRSDVFSLGVVLYEMLTGLSPFQRVTADDTAAAVLSEEPPPVSETTSRVTPAFDGVVRRCLAKRPGDRFRSADQLRRALHALVAPPVKPMRTIRLSRPALMATAVVPLMLLAVFAFMLAHMGYRALLEDSAGTAVQVTVLPFDGPGAAENEDVAATLTEEVVSHLRSMSGLRVISSAGGGTALDTDADADYVLVGVVRREQHPDGGTRWVVRLQLTRVDSGDPPWTASYEISGDALHPDPRDLAHRIAESVRAKIPASDLRGG